MRFDVCKADHGSPTQCNTQGIVSILARCKGAYAKSTLRGYAADLRAFEAWCAARTLDWLPADGAAVAAYIDDEVDALSAATLRRRLAAIGFAHRMSDLPSPTTGSEVLLAVRRAVRRKNRRPAQSKGLTSAIRDQIVRGQPSSPAGLRDAALISVGYDTLCRSAELAAMRVTHLRCDADGQWSVLITRSKSDQAGDGRVAWLSPETIGLLERWLVAAAITEACFPPSLSSISGAYSSYGLCNLFDPSLDRYAAYAGLCTITGAAPVGNT
ncbi:MAG: site-specific integrase [Hyphomonadaceae bacterium]